MLSKKIVIALMIFFLSAQSAFPCTAVFMDKGVERLVGRTMDWVTGNCNVVVNERGIKNTAIYLQDKSKPAVWRSKYGSVTFNMIIQFNPVAKLFMWVKGLHSTSGPSCGINEKGLYGGVFWIHPPPAVIYEPKDTRPSMNDWQVLGYLLDTSANVKEAIINLKKVRVSGFKEAGFEVDQHWFLADTFGDSAVIEFPDGKLKIHRNPVPPVITNSFYEHSRDYMKQFKGFGGTKTIPTEKGEMTSENRYVFAANALQRTEIKNRISIDDIFAIMRSATQTNVRHAQTSQSVTQWTAAYDLNRKQLWWFSRNNPNIKSIDLHKIDFAKTGKTRTIDINYSVAGDVSGKL